MAIKFEEKKYLARMFGYQFALKTDIIITI